ncbi:MAG: hypothetical protein HUU20_17785 [Pirellulales bacterium]|nr:hypothetical protein [Pirellulales bacterium]
MNTTVSCQLRRFVLPDKKDCRAVPMAGLCAVLLFLSAVSSPAEPPAPKVPRAWPQAYSVQPDEASGMLTLSTPYYTVQQDLKRGGAISRIALTRGKAANLLARPLETRVRDESGTVFSDGNDSAPTVTHRREGLNEIVTVECILKDEAGRASGHRVKTTLAYRWGYIKIHKELHAAAGAGAREVCALAAVLAPNLTDYGYREGTTEEEKAPPFSFGSNRWGKLRLGNASDPPLQTRYVPRSMLLVDPGVEGLEWFVGSDLSQWEMQLTGRRGEGRCLLDRSQDPPGLALSVSPLWSPDRAVSLPSVCVFDFYVAFPLIEGSAHGPWLHTSFNRNRGDWVSTEEIRRWAEKGIQTVHCHNDGDYYGDGLFWRDGSYPPYPDMDRYDKVLTDCRQVGIRTATYFSNKELHPSTKEFQEHGNAWGRKDRKGELRHNFYRPEHEFGAQMCLRSGWLEFMKLSIDRVLKNHPLDGVYYDWNVALLCSNPLHEGKREAAAPAKGHWDMDELLDLMEWTRNRVGPSGLVIVHNTTVPMFAVENFADYVVATEWGYRKWTDRAPDLAELPLETSLAGAISRGVISYGVLDRNAPPRLHRLFALEAFLNGVAPWPASEETFALLPLLPKPLGNIGTYRFSDWRTQAVTLSHPRCAAAVYSRPGEAHLLLANLDPDAREVHCVLHPEKLPHPLDRPTTATRLRAPAASRDASNLDVRQLIGEGLKITIPGDDAILVQVR